MIRLVPDDAIIPVDVGNNTYAFGRYFEPEHQSVLMSGYLGSIGFAFPAALGAWAATQEPGSPFAGCKVVSVSSDGGFGQYMSEFTTAVKYDMDITHILLTTTNSGKSARSSARGAGTSSRPTSSTRNSPRSQRTVAATASSSTIPKHSTRCSKKRSRTTARARRDTHRLGPDLSYRMDIIGASLGANA